MSWPSSHVPRYRKHRPSGQAVVTINGRDYYLGPHGAKASKVEYDRLITEYLASGRSSQFGVPEHALTVVELLVDYIKFAGGYYGKSKRGEYAQIVRALRPLRDLYGRLPAEDFGVLEFKAVRQHISTPERSRGYLNEVMGRIVRFFKWAAAEGRISASVPQNLAIIPGLRKGKCDL